MLVDTEKDCENDAELLFRTDDEKLDEELKDVEVELIVENDVDAVNTIRLIENRLISLEIPETANPELKDN